MTWTRFLGAHSMACHAANTDRPVGTRLAATRAMLGTPQIAAIPSPVRSGGCGANCIRRHFPWRLPVNRALHRAQAAFYGQAD